MGRSPGQGIQVISQGPSLLCRVGTPCPAPRESPGARVQGLSLSCTWLSQGTELALCFNSQGSPSGHWGREEDAASWEPAQRLFPWFLWEKIQKKKSIPAEREGVGWDWAWLSGALGALGRCEVLVKPRQRFYSQWALGRAGWASSPPDPLRPLGSSLHSWPTGQVQFHGNFGS